MQTDKSREYHIIETRYNALLAIKRDCIQILDGLADSLSVSGLDNIRGDAFNEWLCNVGMRKLQTFLKDIDGHTLLMLNVSDVMENGVSFSDAADLLLGGYMSHYKLSDTKECYPPRGSVLSWNEEQTANWIKTLDTLYACFSTVGWNGPALCSLSPPRVIEASKGTLKAAEAVKFIGIVRQMRIETDGNKATWISKWNGSIPIDSQPV